MATIPPSPSWARAALGVIANVAVLTSLLVYFGWQRSAAQSHELGISESLFVLSPQDYVLRSVRPVFVLVVAAALGGLAWVWIDHRLRRPGGVLDPDAGPRSTSTQWVVRAVPIVPLAGALIVLAVRPAVGYVLVPASIGTGLLVARYLAALTIDGDDEPDRRRGDVGDLCVAIIVMACAFWTVGNYAKAEGRRLAQALDCARPNEPCPLYDLPRALVYSTHRLGLARDVGAGIVEEQIPDTAADDARYRYSRLRLLEHAGGTYFFVNDDWARRGVVVLLPDDDPNVRVEFLDF